MRWLSDESSDAFLGVLLVQLDQASDLDLHSVFFPSYFCATVQLLY